MTIRTAKAIIVVLVVIVALQATISLAQTALVGTANFSDVPATHPHAVAIQTLKDAGIVSGYGDGNFKPDQLATRAEASAIMLKAVGITATKTAQKIPFTDVPQDAWFFPMIQEGFERGKLKGYPDHTFRPGNSVTLPESLALTLSFFEINVKNIIVEPVIYDGLNTQDWYAKYAQYAKDKMIMVPDSKGHLDPAKGITRGELAEIIYRMRMVKESGKAFDITTNWVTTEYKENYWKLKNPPEWEIFKGLRNSVIWQRDTTSFHAFFTRVWPSTARVSISLVDNPSNFTAAQYFTQLKNAYLNNYPTIKPVFTEQTISGRSTLQTFIRERRILDLAVHLPNGNFLVFYGEYGEAPIGEFLRKQLELIEMSYQFVAAPAEVVLPPLETRISTLRQNILISDKWKEIAPLFPDKKLIYTDAIGIGTGPVDYYYTKEANYTIKLERDSGTILNIKEGETTAF